MNWIIRMMTRRATERARLEQSFVDWLEQISAEDQVRTATTKAG